MQFKKLAAIAGSAIMAGMSLAAPVLATSVTSLDSISDMVGVSDSTVSFPLFVVGAGAATADVAAGIDVAVNMASNAKTTSQVSVEGVSVGITGGTDMSTGTNPIVTWDNFASSKQVLTATDLPTLLAGGSYIDQGSVSVPYAQYLTFNNTATNGQVVYMKRTGGTAPELGLKFTGGYNVYTYLMSFTKQISEAVSSGSVTNMVNSQISMLGKDWTITAATTAGSNDLALTLLSGKNSQTVTTEESSTYSVDGTDYTVTLVAVGTINSVAAATLSVEGGGLSAPQTVQIQNGQTKTLSDGTLIGVTSIFTTTKTGAIDSAVVFLGADKLELADTDMTSSTPYSGVTVNGQSLTDVKVVMTGTASSTALTMDNIQLLWTPSLEQFISAGESVTDPATGGFKMFFGGISPAIDSADREAISITPSGTTASLNFVTSDGQSVSQNFVLTTAATAGSISLQDAAAKTLHILEGEVAAEYEYVVLAQNSLAGSGQNSFGHIIKVINLETSSSSTTTLQDVASGSTLTVTGGNTTLYLDGQAYKVSVLNTTHAQFTWGTSADYSDVGTQIDVYPAIMTSKGAWVALTDNVTMASTANTEYTFNTPTGALTVNSTTLVTNGASAVGTAYYNVTVGGTNNTITIAATDNSAATTPWTTPGVMIVEGLDQSQVRNIVAARLDASTTVNRAKIAATPAFTDSGVQTSDQAVSGTTLNRYMDAFGTYVTYDSTDPCTFSASVPSTQAQAIVGVGVSPAPSGGSTGSTVTTETVLPITADVVKLDTEVTDTDRNTKDMVLLGGPCINSLVAELADDGTFPYTCADWPGSNFGRVELVSDAFASGYTALVIAGTTAADTDLAARIVQTGFPGATDAQTMEAAIEVTGSVSSPAYS
ncbi:MAG: S-layer protein [Candidatus Aenigmarchaeota archaeon]|nr:S-layer protein [Candidatus Aenigmarchaeota archaeon]